MRLVLIAALSAVAGLACTPTEPGYSGYPVTDFFPLDGVREWSFRSADATVPYELVGTKPLEGVTATDDGFTQIFDIRFEQVCISEDESCVDGEFAFAWQQSASQDRGAFLWGYETPAGAVTFDPPVKLADRRTKVGDVMTTETGGHTWTATFLMTADCEVVWNPNWTNCMVLVIDDGGEGGGFAGTYWLATGYHIVAFEREGLPARCSLSNHEYAEF